MKKILLIFVVSATLISCGSDNNNQDLTTDMINNPISADGVEIDEDNLPFFEFVEEIIEFGTIAEGETVMSTFRFKNVGKTNLIISSAQGSCGCTVPEWPKEPIKPGDEGEITVSFNSTGKKGLQNKTITIKANTMPNTVVIAIKGEVITSDNN